jgi:hypothetical protein
MWAEVEQEGACYVVSLAFEDKKNRIYKVEEAFEADSIEAASAEITSLAEAFNIARQDVSFSVQMENYREGILH